MYRDPYRVEFRLVPLGKIPKTTPGYRLNCIVSRHFSLGCGNSSRSGSFQGMPAIVIAVSRSTSHSFNKPNEPTIRLVAGLGVEGDAHMGEKVKHRYHVLKNPNAPNLRQACNGSAFA